MVGTHAPMPDPPTPDPCPPRPLVPPEPKLFVGDVELRGTFAVRIPIYDFDKVTTVEGACDVAKEKMRGNRLRNSVSFEIEETEAFCDGE